MISFCFFIGKVVDGNPDWSGFCFPPLFLTNLFSPFSFLLSMRAIADSFCSSATLLMRLCSTACLRFLRILWVRSDKWKRSAWYLWFCCIAHLEFCRGSKVYWSVLSEFLNPRLCMCCVQANKEILVSSDKHYYFVIFLHHRSLPEF